jgi:lysophospholipase L1-like esterase
MTRIRISWAVAVLATLLLQAASAGAKTKIACVGASTTSGDGSTAGHHYPDELQRLVAPDGEVKNFGVSGTTMLRNVAASYWKTPMLAQALAYAPDVVVIWFGGNDAKPENWTTHKGEFLGDYEAMLQMFQALPSHPRTYVVLSLVTHDTGGIPKAVVDGDVIPLVRQAAADTGSGVVDVHDALAAHPEYFPDGIHPDNDGTLAIAKMVYAALNAPLPDGGVDANADVTPVTDVAGQHADAPAVADAEEDAGSPPPPDATVADAPSFPDASSPSPVGPDGSTGGSVDDARPTGQKAHGGGCSLAGSPHREKTPRLLVASLAVTGWLFGRRRRKPRA